MPTCFSCSKPANGCSFNEELCLVPVCSNCASSTTIWCAPSQFMATAISQHRSALDNRIDETHSDFIKHGLCAARKLLDKPSDWRKALDRACDTLQDSVKRLLDEHAQRESKYTEAALLPLVATVATPCVVEAAITIVGKDAFRRAHTRSLERARQVADAHQIVTEYDSPDLLAVHDRDRDRLLAISRGSSVREIERRDCMAVSGPVSAGAVCAVVAMLEQQGYGAQCCLYFTLGVRNSPPSLAIWNHSTQHLVRVALPPVAPIQAVMFAAMVSDGLLYLSVTGDDSQKTYFTIPSSALYSRCSV